jgi:hypothetical protein
MSNRRVEIKRIATNKPGTFLEVSVGYRDGNSEFSSGQRGYYLNVSYVETRDGWEFHVLGRGGAGLLETATRFNQKRLNQLADQGCNPENRALDQIVVNVLVKNGLKLAEVEPAEAELVTA